jgi:serine/threonine protein kinase
MLSRIGKYEIRTELGKGGMGQVYLAYDATMNRLVAIKVLAPTDDSSTLIRFQTEAIAVGNLNHPNIVTVYEFGEDRGVVFLAMEYLAGHDLQKVIESAGSRSLLEKMGIMAQIAKGLLCAHRGGIVHRDVKPANIMVLPDGIVKVMDFGIARLTKENSARLTQTGFLIGSVSHMAPEQFGAGEADILCDIWSYGTIYYELLTGKSPFYAASLPATMARIMNVEPDRVKSLCPDCPDALELVLSRLLAKDRANRYQSLEDVLFDMAPILAELQKGEIAELISLTARNLEEGQFDEARQGARKILALDPTHREGRKLHEQIQNELRIRLTRGRVEDLRRKAENAASEHNYGEAIDALGLALQIQPSETALQVRLVELQTTQEHHEKTQRLLTYAQSQLDAQKLTSAFQSAKEARDADPDNSEAAKLVSRLEHLIAERDAAKRLAEGLAETKRLLVVEALDEAVEVLKDLAMLAPEHPEVRELLARTRNQREARDRRIRITVGVETARAAIRVGDLSAAVKILQDLADEFPSDDSVKKTLADTRDELHAKEQAARIKAMGNQAWAALKAKRFDEAQRLVEEGISVQPGSEKLLRLQEVIFSSRAEHERNEAIQTAIAESAKLDSADRLIDSLAVLDSALRQFPDQSDLTAAREEVRRRLADLEQRRHAEAIQDALAKARGMVEVGKAESATKLLMKATALYPNDPELASLLDWAQKEQKRQSESQQVKKILSQADELEKNGRLRQALEAVDESLRAFPASSELASAAARLRTLIQLQKDLDAIAQPMASNDWATALPLITDAMERHPGEESLSRLEGQVRQQQREASVEALCVQARRELDARDLDRAQETVKHGVETFGANPKLAALQAEIARELERRENLASARQCCRTRDWMRAEVILRRMLDRDPADQEARTLLDQVLDERETERLIKVRGDGEKEARRLLRELRFDEAEAKWRAILADYPGDPALLEELRRLEEAKKDHLRQELYRNGRLSAARFLKSAQFDAATNELNALLAQFPEDAALKQDLAGALAAKEDQLRRTALNEALSSASEMQARREFDSALRILNAYLARFPDEPAIRDEIQRATEAKALFEERQSADRQVSELEKFYRKGDPSGIIDRTSQTDLRKTDPRIRELAQWAQTEMAALAREAPRESSVVLQQRRRHRVLMGAGIAAAALLFVSLALYMKSRPTPHGFGLDPQEITFRVDFHAKNTDPQTVSLTTKGGLESWSASSTDAWLSANPNSGATPAAIKVFVNPADLDPGSHSALLAFSGNDASLSAKLKVRVIVQQPAKIEPKRTESSPPKSPSPTTANLPNKPSEPEVKQIEQIEAAPSPSLPTPAPALPPAPAIVDCHAPTYHSLREGRLIWANGAVEPNGTLVLGETGKIVAGGKVTGTNFPGCDISLTVDLGEVEIAEAPAPANGFRSVKLRNKSSAAISDVIVRWRVK